MCPHVFGFGEDDGAQAGEDRTDLLHPVAAAGPPADPLKGVAAGSVQRALPAPGFADVRIVAASPEAARTIARVLRLRFAATEPRSADADAAADDDDAADGGTRLDLTVDTVHFPDPSGPFQLRLVGGSGRRPRGVREVTDIPPSPRPRRPAPDDGGAEPPPTIQDDPSGDRPTR
jgi:hypothetical protein